MAKLKIVKQKKLINVLEKLGFYLQRSSGKHFIYHNKECKIIPVPKAQREIGKGLLRKIISEIDIDVEEFNKLL